MNDAAALTMKWLETRDRLRAKGLLGGDGASLSLRCPGQPAMWFGVATAAAPAQVRWDGAALGAHAGAHADVYIRRGDIGALACGSGPFGACLADFGGRLPQVFDEQARHLGSMAVPATRDVDLATALGEGGYAQFAHGHLFCAGTTATRLALNAELFEKCAKAYVLACAVGGSVKELPWWVRRIANSRLRRDQRRAAASYARGEWPAESGGY